MRDLFKIPDLTVLGNVNSSFGFFCTDVFTAIRRGRIYACIGAPTLMHIESSLSVYLFLRMQGYDTISRILI